jgi:type I restriction enzyme S subunit
MSDSSIPKEWQSTTLEYAGKWGSGGTPKRTESRYYNGEIPWLIIGDLNNGVVRESDNSITKEGLDNSSAKLVPPGTVLIAMYGSIGKMGLTAIECATNQAIAFCSPVQGCVVTKYLFHYLMQQRDSLLSSGKGGAQQNISQTVLKAHPFPLPPLEEQKEITERLDELLAQVDTLKTRLDAIPSVLKRFRQSTLAAATYGKLTEQWREENVYDAKSQLEEIKSSHPSKPAKNDLAKFHELPSSWEWALVKEVGSVQLGRQRAPKYHSGANMRPYLRVANVMEGYIDTSDIMSMVFDEEDYAKYRLSDGDILLNEGQSHELVGRPAIFKGEVSDACFTNTLVRFRPYSSVSIQFSYYLFLTYLKAGRFQEIASRTVNISHLGAGRFADMEFPFPPFEEQTEIVRRVEELFTFADQVEQRVNDAQARVNHLTQSILAKAFRGELTSEWRTNHPDLITGENSAAALLKRIKTEREKQTPKKKTRKKK